jgi:transposase-like protein
MSNTESAVTQWKQIAETLGFSDEPSMWHQLYAREGRTVSELAKTLGFGTATVTRRMHLCGVDRKSRGGANSPSKVAIAVEHLDPRFVTLAEPRELAELVDCSVHSIYRVLKERS